jgi:hypothetical protein
VTKADFGLSSLKNNDDLLDYLYSLQVELGSAGEYKLADLVVHVQLFASGSPSEFFHEAKVALKTITQECRALSQERLQQVSVVVTQIDLAFDAIGGA